MFIITVRNIFLLVNIVNSRRLSMNSYSINEFMQVWLPIGAYTMNRYSCDFAAFKMEH